MADAPLTPEEAPICPTCDGYGEELVSGDPRSDNYVTAECRTCYGEGRLFPDIIGEERYEELLEEMAAREARLAAARSK